MKYDGWKLDKTTIDRQRKGIAYDVATQLLSDYHKRNGVLSFWDILLFLSNCGHQSLMDKKTNRDRFFRYVRVELEQVLGISVRRHFTEECGVTDSEYRNWFHKRRFLWKPTGINY